MIVPVLSISIAMVMAGDSGTAPNAEADASPPSPSGAGSTENLDRFARAVTEISTPAVYVFLISLLCGAYGEPGIAGALWGVAIGLGTGVTPYVLLELGSRRRFFTDRHVTSRQQRPAALAVCIAAVVVSGLTLWLLDGPVLLSWALITMLVALLVAVVLTKAGIKVSMHALCLSAFFLLAALLTSPWWLLGGLTLLPLVSWSRLRLNHHTRFEVVIGAAVATVITLGAWMLAPL